MSETFGHFRLIQKIEDDVLGEIFCAAWPDEDGLEEVGLLRRFDHDALPAERFLAQTADRHVATGAAINDVLVGSLESGAVEARAYDLYPYLSASTLATLTHRARLRRESYPLEVALWIVGRVAAGLSAAFRQEIAGANVQHGFLTPHLILISEEGGVKLCGLETAPALRELRGTAETFAKILPYLSPEYCAGKDLHPSDDVYSLGALLYELITLRPLASPAELRDESSSIPSELRYFLARSVAPRFRRIQSVVEWLHELKAMVVQEGWVASAQDLSAFVARLDERLNPLKPDTAQLTKTDREIFARAIRKAQAQAEASAPATPTDDTDSTPTDSTPTEELATDQPQDDGDVVSRDDSVFQTAKIARNILEPLAAEGHLVRTAHVKIVPSA